MFGFFQHTLVFFFEVVLQMKPGDLVRMKYEMWWKVRNRKAEYTQDLGLILNTHHNAIKVLLPSGRIKSCLAESWEVVSENKRE